MDEQEQSNVTRPRIWNPNAAANWSLLFTPVFGSLLHALNWKAMGKPEKATSGFIWAGAFLVYMLLSIILPIGKLWVVFLIVWYFVAGRPQAKYVKETFGEDYDRKPWGLPLGIAVGGYIVYFILIVVVVSVISVIQGTIQ